MLLTPRFLRNTIHCSCDNRGFEGLASTAPIAQRATSSGCQCSMLPFKLYWQIHAPVPVLVLRLVSGILLHSKSLQALS